MNGVLNLLYQFLVIIDIEKIEDNRGFFARNWCKRDFEEHNLNNDLVQCSISYNEKCGTLRGMHYQGAPYEETKIVRCTYGVIYDVIVDLRPESSTFKEWVAVELSSENWRMIYIPPGIAHGFQTLVDDVEVYYQVSEYYSPEFSKSVRWDDSAFCIEWPDVEKRVISERDSQHPDFIL